MMTPIDRIRSQEFHSDTNESSQQDACFLLAALREDLVDVATETA